MANRTSLRHFGGGSGRGERAGAKPVPLSATRSVTAKKNVLARERWDQGYLVNRESGLVLFLTERTCRRIAALAETNTHRTMIVTPHGDGLWGYREAS